MYWLQPRGQKASRISSTLPGSRTSGHARGRAHLLDEREHVVEHPVRLD
ncbi:hypothetical protein AB0F96_15795 [Streptomyces sp. NPDC023998]